MSTTTRKTSVSPPIQKPRGNMKPAEIKPLVIAARKAFDRQSEAGLLDNGETFDTWRHTQCMAAVGRPGITACYHEDFRPLLAHFQTLAGDDASAFRSLLKTGQPTDHAAPGDTHEARRILVHQIAEALAAHHSLATADPATLSSGLASRAESIAAKGKGPITVGYVVFITRQKTRRPDLTLGRDWQAGLAEHCTVSQLTQIRDTVINRIAATEGVGSPSSRNKSQRASKSRTARHGIDFL
jgi:hypothetical protein